MNREDASITYYKVCQLPEKHVFVFVFVFVPFAPSYNTEIYIHIILCKSMCISTAVKMLKKYITGQPDT